MLVPLPPPHTCVSIAPTQQLKQARYKKLENLVNLASKRADLSSGVPPTVVVSLLENDVLKPAVTSEGMFTVSE